MGEILLPVLSSV